MLKMLYDALIANSPISPTAPPCTAGLDVGIVLDKSKSIRIPNLKKGIEFLGNLVKNFNPTPDVDHFVSFK